MSGRFRLVAAAAAALLGACAGLQATDPPVARDAVEALAGSGSFSAAPVARADALDAGALPWWQRFDDPALAQWVERALAANLDIALAAERTRQAQALLQQAQAARGPRLLAQGELEWRVRGGDGPGSSGERRLQPGAAIALDLDLDAWGGLRAAQRSAAAGLLRSQELVQAARLSAAGLAARAYVEWQLARAEQRLLQDAALMLTEALRIVSVRVEAGISPVLDRERALAELASNEAALAAAAVRAGQALAALQVVAGMAPRPGPLALVVDGPGASPGAMRSTAFGEPPTRLEVRQRSLPALAGGQPLVQPLDLLRLRPDLRAAEQAVRLAAADVGVAEAELLPRLRLPGSVVFGATSGGAVLGLASAVLAAALDVTLLDGGARAARRDAAQSRLREAALAWQQAVLVALQQVEGTLLAQQGAAERIDSARRSRDAARAAQAQAETLYRVGLTNYLDVVEAQRTALAGERLLLQAQAESAFASVRAFETMGLMPPATP